MRTGHWIVPHLNVHDIMIYIYLDDRLKFDTHISQMCSKAFRQINALKRIARHLDEESRTLLYKSFISSTFNLSSFLKVCGQQYAVKLENLHERALVALYLVTLIALITRSI